MNRSKKVSCGTFLLFALCGLTGTVQAAKISGPITTTLTISEDSQLAGDVTCTVSGAACIAIGAPNVTLDLKGFTMTGLGDSQTGCGGGATTGEQGIDINGQSGVTVRGPGLVQRFRQFGIRLVNNTGSTITGVTLSTNCFSGIILIGGSNNEIHRNVSIRNGNLNNPCGGI
jgi:Periplasmic copper-binding protein (NosD)